MSIEIIPAIDIIDGKCVRLSQGDYERKTIYNEDPLEVAKMFEAYGLQRLHLVDLDGAKAHHIVNYKVLERIALHTTLTIDFGGGIKSDRDVETAFEAGADMVTGGSIAVKSPAVMHKWIETYGSERIILGADSSDGKIAVSGWTENSGLDLFAFVQHWKEKGIDKVISTDISRDGMLTGPAIEMYKEILRQIPGIYLIASGGVGTIQDILALEKIGIPAVIVGKAIYEGKISLEEIGKINTINLL
ncbi:MAG: 1-(5-phosphoribosyl)-5-[(5-phosphoribosylamino)methylideneamino]imidazole-4-carboxamide isomerase [Prolixibacteraceae bacterium]